MSCGIGRRLSSDLTFLWLWYRLAAITLIWPLAWEPPYAMSAALKRPQKKRELFVFGVLTFPMMYFVTNFLYFFLLGFIALLEPSAIRARRFLFQCSLAASQTSDLKQSHPFLLLTCLQFGVGPEGTACLCSTWCHQGQLQKLLPRELSHLADK